MWGPGTVRLDFCLSGQFTALASWYNCPFPQRKAVTADGSPGPRKLRILPFSIGMPQLRAENAMAFSPLSIFASQVQRVKLKLPHSCTDLMHVLISILHQTFHLSLLSGCQLQSWETGPLTPMNGASLAMSTSLLAFSPFTSDFSPERLQGAPHLGSYQLLLNCPLPEQMHSLDLPGKLLPFTKMLNQLLLQ